MANDRLIRAKQQLAGERAAKGIGTGIARPARDRLPPGQKLVQGWPVLDLGIQPAVSREEWGLHVHGAVAERRLRWADFAALPQVTLTTDFHCVTVWSIYDARVEGVLWPDLLAILRPAPAATHVLLHGYDGYTTNLPLAELALPEVAVIHSYGGEPLSTDHGGPVRLWVPHLYGWKSAKWLCAIEFMTGDQPGFWEVRGYHNHGDPWREQRYSQAQVDG